MQGEGGRKYGSNLVEGKEGERERKRGQIFLSRIRTKTGGQPPGLAVRRGREAERREAGSKGKQCVLSYFSLPLPSLTLPRALSPSPRVFSSLPPSSVQARSVLPPLHTSRPRTHTHKTHAVRVVQWYSSSSGGFRTTPPPSSLFLHPRLCQLSPVRDAFVLFLSGRPRQQFLCCVLIRMNEGPCTLCSLFLTLSGGL